MEVSFPLKFLFLDNSSLCEADKKASLPLSGSASSSLHRTSGLADCVCHVAADSSPVHDLEVGRRGRGELSDPALEVSLCLSHVPSLEMTH